LLLEERRILFMAEKTIINIIATQCQPQDEEKFNKWYNEVHIPMLLKAKGLKGVARYKISDESSQTPRFLAIYKYASQKDLEAFQKSPETAAAIQDLEKTWGKKVELTSRTKCELIKEW
jgi:uncharacterized protein (TIGR02118 family)